SVASDGRDLARGVDFPYAVVSGIGDVDVAARIDSDAVNVGDLGAGAGFVIAEIAGISVSGDGADVSTRGGHHSDAVAVIVGDVDIAVGIDGYAEWPDELGAGGGAAVSVIPQHAADAGYRRNRVLLSECGKRGCEKQREEFRRPVHRDEFSVDVRPVRPVSQPGTRIVSSLRIVSTIRGTRRAVKVRGRTLQE